MNLYCFVYPKQRLLTWHIQNIFTSVTRPFCFVRDPGTKCTESPQLQSIGPYPLPPFAKVSVLNVLIRYEHLFLIHEYKPRVLSIGHEYSQSSSNEQNSTPCLPQACHYKVNFINHPIRILSGQELYCNHGNRKWASPGP